MGKNKDLVVLWWQSVFHLLPTLQLIIGSAELIFHVTFLMLVWVFLNYLAVVVVTEIVIEIVMNDEKENEVGLQENVEIVTENRTGIEIETGI